MAFIKPPPPPQFQPSNAEICQAIVMKHKTGKSNDLILVVTKFQDQYTIRSLTAAGAKDIIIPATSNKTLIGKKFNQIIQDLLPTYTPVSLQKFACPLCGKDTKQIIGKYGLFYGCNGYPDCDGIVQVSGNPAPKTLAKMNAAKFQSSSKIHISKQKAEPEIESDFRLDEIE